MRVITSVRHKGRSIRPDLVERLAEPAAWHDMDADGNIPISRRPEYRCLGGHRIVGPACRSHSLNGPMRPSNVQALPQSTAVNVVLSVYNSSIAWSVASTNLN